ATTPYIAFSDDDSWWRPGALPRAVVRREAYLAVGGFEELLGVGGEEELLACDLAAAGWHATYVDDSVAEHWPSPARDPDGRRVVQRRNDVLVRWMRRPLGNAVAATAALAGRAPRDPVARRGLAGTLARLPAALRRRRRLPAHVEDLIRLRDGE